MSTTTLERTQRAIIAVPIDLDEPAAPHTLDDLMALDNVIVDVWDTEGEPFIAFIGPDGTHQFEPTMSVADVEREVSLRLRPLHVDPIHFREHGECRHGCLACWRTNDPFPRRDFVAAGLTIDL